MRGVLFNEVSPSEMRRMYMEDGETYDTVAKRLDVSPITVMKYVAPLLSDEEKMVKRRAPKLRRETPKLFDKDFAQPMLDYKAKLAQERAEREKPKLELLETSLMYAGVCEYTVMEKSKTVCIGKENGICRVAT